MKRIIAIFLCCIIVLSGCVTKREEDSAYLDFIDIPDSNVEFTSLQDPNLLQYVEDEIYAELEDVLSNDAFVIEQVVTTFVSKEYIEELDYNSKENI